MKMKIVLFTILILLFCGNLFCQVIEVIPTSCKVVSSDSNSTECKYELDNSTVTGTPREFKLITEQLYGNIESLINANASDNFSYWIATETGQDEKSGLSFIYRKNKAYSDKPDWNQVQTFRNTGDELALYLTLSNNSDNETGDNGTIDITFGKKRQ